MVSFSFLVSLLLFSFSFSFSFSFCNVNRLSRSILGLHSDPYYIRIVTWDWDWRVTMPEHTAAGATMRSVAWRLLSAVTVGFESSSTVCRAPSEAEGFEADPSFTIAATDLLSSRTLPNEWLSALPIQTGIRIWLPVTSDPSTFPVRCYGFQYPTDESYQSKGDLSICQDLCEWYGDLRWLRGLERQVTVDLRDGAFICADRA